jgi:hypothetical protein
MAEGLPLPKRIANAPQLAQGLELYYEAFWELSSARAVGFGVGPIPWGVVDSYATRYAFDDEQREDLTYYVRAMDNAYIKHHQPKTGR